ncbi:MAG: hypothetical protein HY282_16835 [Nitrospirae bacterium]|nr:hypothetical protein [Candidatus Manganitrophaceae bacterium]
MFPPRSKKITLLFLAIFYFSALFLGTLCSFDSPTGQTHHHGRTVSHTASCLLACASSSVAARPQNLTLTLFLLFIGMSVALGKGLSPRSIPLRLQSRAPPLSSLSVSAGGLLLK